MTRKLIIAAVLVAALVAGALLRQQLADPPPTASAPPADARLEFTLPDLEGRARAFSEWSGRPRIVNYWATWCAPCRREIPLLKSLQEEHAGIGLQVIGIAVDFAEDVLAYAEETDFNYPVLIGQDDAVAAAEDAGIPVPGLPVTAVIAPGGEILGVRIGEIHAEQLERIVATLARLARGESGVDEAREALADL